MEPKVIELPFGLWHAPWKTQREIARMLGILRSCMSRIEKRAVPRLAREVML